MNFVKYQHVERYGTDEVDGINIGTCYVFPKIDGTNSSVWPGDDGLIHGGSRNRELAVESDNAGFFNSARVNQKIIDYLAAHPTHRLYGEWLVPHTLKTYREDAWRKFYVFDVCIDKDDGSLEYIPYDIYKAFLDEFEIDYLSPIRIIKNGEYDDFVKCLDENTYLVKDGEGFGEGVVIKNYDFYNKYGRQTWAKIVRAEFKEKHGKTMGAPVSECKMVEEDIVDEYVTAALIDKERAKIVNDNSGWTSKCIPILLSTVFHELINEEMWNILKKFKNPKIDFRALNTLVIAKIKSTRPDIFC